MILYLYYGEGTNEFHHRLFFGKVHNLLSRHVCFPCKEYNS